MEPHSSPEAHEPAPRTNAVWRLGFPVVAGGAAFALVDAVGTSRVGAVGLGATTVLALRVLLYTLPLYLAAGALIALLVAATQSLLRRAVTAGLPPFEPSARRDLLAAMLPPVSGFVAGLAHFARVSSTRFNNHVLGGLLVALVALGLVTAASALALALFIGLRRVRARLTSRPRTSALLRWGLSAVAPLVVAIHLSWLNRDGFRILGVWLFAGPLAAVVATALAVVLMRVRLPLGPKNTWRIAIASFLVSIAATFLVSLVSSSTPFLIVQGGLWSKHLLTVARAATDLDRDGASSWFGGGDCAPFDRSIHPGAYDVPGDGIDNNCANGDAQPAGAEQPPVWYDAKPGVGKSKNLVVITIEALRSDHVSFLGYEHPNMPQLGKLAARSIVFERMYSATSATTLSLSALWTTQVPSYTRTRPGAGHAGIHASMPWVPELLRKQGFATAAILGDYLAFTRDGWNMGFDRGFTHYDTSTHINMQGGMFYGFPGAEMIDKAIRWLDQSGGKPFMLWMHLVEPHAKYERAPKAPNLGDDEQELYASDIWAADEQVGRLVAYLTDKGLLDSTLMIVTGDHGEEFGEHGNKFHYSSLYEQQVRTVGVMHVPGVGHRRVTQPVVHQDLTTTAMNLLGVREGFEELRGRNVMPTFEGERVEPSSFFIELAGFQVRVRSFALVDWPFKLLHPKGSTIYTLFHLEKDPGERTDVAAKFPDVHARMKEAMIRHVEAIGEHLKGKE